MEPYPQTQQLAVIRDERLPSTDVGRCAPADQLIGDVERSALCDQLSTAFAAGRLTDQELDQRLARAVAARTRREAQLLLRDLRPSVPPTPVADIAPSRPPWSTFDIVVVLVFIGCTVSVAGMLLVSIAVSPAWFFCALVGGTLAVMAGASATQLIHRSVRRRQPTVGPAG